MEDTTIQKSSIFYTEHGIRISNYLFDNPNAENISVCYKSFRKSKTNPSSNFYISTKHLKNTFTLHTFRNQENREILIFLYKVVHLVKMFLYKYSLIVVNLNRDNFWQHKNVEMLGINNPEYLLPMNPKHTNFPSELLDEYIEDEDTFLTQEFVDLVSSQNNYEGVSDIKKIDKVLTNQISMAYKEIITPVLEWQNAKEIENLDGLLSILHLSIYSILQTQNEFKNNKEK